MEKDFLLMSIKTKFAEQIFNGTKKYEFRKKTIGEENIGKIVFIYSAQNDKKIIGYIIFSEIIEGNLEKMLKLTNDITSIKEYFKDSKTCYALKINKYIRFKNPITPNETMPQFFKYISKKNKIYNILMKQI